MERKIIEDMSREEIEATLALCFKAISDPRVQAHPDEIEGWKTRILRCEWQLARKNQ